jgi:oxygen-independent coproporphyrinogen-3 oxidase
MMPVDLFAKYDVAVPRYTSYPTVPQWQDTPTRDRWLASIGAGLGAGSSLSMYLHIPFCESLCTYCGCNTVITRNHGRDRAYVDLLLAELDLYLAALPDLAGRPLRQLHLGGGTPTFLSPDDLSVLLDGLAARLPVRDGRFEGAIEVDPRVTTPAHLDALRVHGLTRLSLGVQDVSDDVQQLVNRIQPVPVTAALTSYARTHGFESINFDLIYGLPGQTLESMARLADVVLELAPDRLAVYSFARVPWIKPAQRKFRDDQIPVGAAKRALYEVVRTRLLAGGYEEIGGDHFARPDDGLARAAGDGTLHRNFMGYAELHTTTLLGLGVSAISESPDCYHQNEKVLAHYERRVLAGEIPTLRGHVLTADDARRRRKILDVMTSFRATLDDREVAQARAGLASFVADGLVTIDDHELRVLPAGRPFLRNVATFFDAYYQEAPPAGPLYSRAV